MGRTLGLVRAVARHELFAAADVVSLHLVLAASTAGIVGRDEFAAMKRSAVLVNTERAGLVDEAALLVARDRARFRLLRSVRWHRALAGTPRVRNRAARRISRSAT